MTLRHMPDLERPLLARGRGNQTNRPPINIVLLDFPVELLPTSVGFAAAADPDSAARPVSQPPGDRAGRANDEVSWQSRCRTCRSTKGIYSEDGQWTCSRCGDEWQVPET